MCITPEQVTEIVNKEIARNMFELMPQAIAKGIQSAQTHLRMSEDTRKTFESHNNRIVFLEDTMKKNGDTLDSMHKMLTDHIKDENETIKGIKPYLSIIAESVKARDAKGYLKRWLFEFSKLSVALIAIIALARELGLLR